MHLSIDTSNSKQTIVKLGDKELINTQTTPNSQITLELINELLLKQKKSLHDITAITVNPGPGSFTGLRVGIAIANALRFALNLGKPLEPMYGELPHITTSQAKPDSALQNKGPLTK